MGRMQAQEMAGMSLDLDTMLGWHLQHNHYPPVHVVFIPTCKEAIERANMEEWEHEIKMPNDITKTVADIVSNLHLEEFLSSQD